MSKPTEREKELEARVAELERQLSGQEAPVRDEIHYPVAPPDTQTTPKEKSSPESKSASGKK